NALRGSALNAGGVALVNGSMIEEAGVLDKRVVAICARGCDSTVEAEGEIFQVDALAPAANRVPCSLLYNTSDVAHPSQGRLPYQSPIRATRKARAFREGQRVIEAVKEGPEVVIGFVRLNS